MKYSRALWKGSHGVHLSINSRTSPISFNGRQIGADGSQPLAPPSLMLAVCYHPVCPPSAFIHTALASEEERAAAAGAFCPTFRKVWGSNAGFQHESRFTPVNLLVCVCSHPCVHSSHVRIRVCSCACWHIFLPTFALLLYLVILQSICYSCRYSI